MIPSQQVKHPVDAKESELGDDRVPVFGGLVRDTCPGDRDVPQVIAGAREREHIGGRIIAGIQPVQATELPVAGDAHSDAGLPFRQPGLHLAQRRSAGEKRVCTGRPSLYANYFITCLPASSLCAALVPKRVTSCN